MSRIGEAVKRVVETSPENAWCGVISQNIVRHRVANEELTKVVCNNMSAEEMMALFDCLLDIFTDELDEEMKAARDLIKERIAFV